MNPSCPPAKKCVSVASGSKHVMLVGNKNVANGLLGHEDMFQSLTVRSREEVKIRLVWRLPVEMRMSVMAREWSFHVW